MLLSRGQRFIVVTKTDPVTGRLRRAIEENVFAPFLVMANDIRFTAGPFHLAKRPGFVGLGLQPGLYFRPVEPFMTVHVFLETSLQRLEQLFTLLGWQWFLI